MTPARRPDRSMVLRIVAQEARATGADVSRVLSMAIDRKSKVARRAAMLRIVAETGCSRSGLATVWGCDRQVVCRADKPPRPGTQTIFSTRVDRAGEHANACDPDLMAWRRLGQRSAAA